MRICSCQNQRMRVSRCAFTFVEVIVGMAVVGIVVLALYAGLSSGFTVIQTSRENQRATQILVEKMETVRLYNWDQITSPTNFIPRTFQTYYYSDGVRNGGALYQGTITITNAPVDPAYTSDMKMVIVNINWVQGHLPRSREIRTFVSRYGLQNYVY